MLRYWFVYAQLAFKSNWLHLTFRKIRCRSGFITCIAARCYFCPFSIPEIDPRGKCFNLNKNSGRGDMLNFIQFIFQFVFLFSDFLSIYFFFPLLSLLNFWSHLQSFKEEKYVLTTHFSAMPLSEEPIHFRNFHTVTPDRKYKVFLIWLWEGQNDLQLPLLNGEFCDIISRWYWVRRYCRHGSSGACYQNVFFWVNFGLQRTNLVL